MDPDWAWHCAEPAVAAVAKATGRDIWAELGGCPRSWAQARDLYQRIGARCLADCMTYLFGSPIEPKIARRGDICLQSNRHGAALGVCRGDVVEYFNVTLPLSEAAAAWRVTGRP